jgi:hypothetical protein
MTEGDGRANGQERLLAYSQPLNQTLVSVEVGVFKIIQKSSSLADKLQEAASGMVILDVSLEMLGEVLDPLAEQRNLHLWRAGVRLMKPKLLHDYLTLWLSNPHNLRFFSLFLLVEKFLPYGITVVKVCDRSLSTFK